MRKHNSQSPVNCSGAWRPDM